MEFQTQRKATPQGPVLAEKAPAGTSDLKASLRTMSYDEGAKALSPTGSLTGAPVQMKEGADDKKDSAAQTKGDGKKAAAPGAPTSNKATKPKGDAKGKAPTADAKYWYEMPLDSTGLPPAYEKAVPADLRVVKAYVPAPGAPAVKVCTTQADWVAVKIAIQQSRYDAAQFEADVANKNATDAKAGAKAGKLVVKKGVLDANGFMTYYTAPEEIPEHDCYKLGFNFVTRQNFSQLQSGGWPNNEIQKLCNIQPGFTTAVQMVGVTGPAYRSEIPEGQPVPTKYAIKHRAQIYPQNWVKDWTDATKPVD